MRRSPLFRPREIAFYTTPPHPCAYLEGREAVTLVADPRATMESGTYSLLADAGFRRSGCHVYRPRCPGCDACLAVRLPVGEFRPDRSQRRAWERNRDLRVEVKEAAFAEEHFALYRRYTAARHGGGGMDTDQPEQYSRFLICDWAETRFVEFRDRDDRLLAVAVVDLLTEGLSAVYTFFDPEEARRGLGVQAVLWQIEEARRRGLPWLFLGYWIAESPKMAYKIQYRPLEAYREGRWQRLPSLPLPETPVR